jgi:hypothetical protein
MFRRVLYIILVTIGFCLSMTFYLKAQRPSSEDMQIPEVIVGFDQIESKLDALSKELLNSNKDVSRKLDQVLSNQDKIFKELEVVKVRASRSH